MKIILFFSVLFLIQASLVAQKSFFPPQTPVHAVTDTLHGVLITDDYRWLENKADPAVINWTRASTITVMHTSKLPEKARWPS